VTRFLIDVNVVLDFVLDRQPYTKAATALWGLAEAGEIEAVVPAHGVTTVFYLAARERGAAFAHRLVNDLVVVPSIAAVDGPVLRRALSLGWADFEDAVCAASAEAARCDWIVTRDPRGFRDSPVPAVDPATALALLMGSRGPEGVAEKAAVDYARKPARRRGPKPRPPRPGRSSTSR
jgi:predicted nucleic acid-binding protein